MYGSKEIRRGETQALGGVKALCGSSPGSVLIVTPPLELDVVGGVGRTIVEFAERESGSHREFRRR